MIDWYINEGKMEVFSLLCWSLWLTLFSFSERRAQRHRDCRALVAGGGEVAAGGAAGPGGSGWRDRQQSGPAGQGHGKMQGTFLGLKVFQIYKVCSK